MRSSSAHAALWQWRQDGLAARVTREMGKRLPEAVGETLFAAILLDCNQVLLRCRSVLGQDSLVVS